MKKTKKIILTSCTAVASLGVIPCITASLTSCSNTKKPQPSKLDHLMKMEVLSGTTLETITTDWSHSPDMWFSKNGGENWTQITQSASKLHFDAGDIVYFAGNNPDGFSWETHWTTLKLTCDDETGEGIKLSGSIMSLLGDYDGTLTTIPNDYCFKKLFDGSTAIKEVSAGFLPATNLTMYCYDLLFARSGLIKVPFGLLPALELKSGCYESMFATCLNLETISEDLLPATKLADSCYETMFSGCLKLKNIAKIHGTKAPFACCSHMYAQIAATSIPEGALPATELEGYCYSSMFLECTELVTVPKNLLPAMTVYQSSYGNMFERCSNLLVAPDLPATNLLEEMCYIQMFENCYSLREAPALPAESVPLRGYQFMFSYCTSLQKVNEISAKTLGENACEKMFNRCSSLTDATPTKFAPTKIDNDSCTKMFAYTSIETPLMPPATEMAERCYEGMYEGCTNLKTLPDFSHITSLENYCFRGMFRSCTGLTGVTKLPELKFTDLKTGCYQSMYQDCNFPDAVCSSMSSFVLPATTPAIWCYWDMFKGSNIATLPTIKLTKAMNSSMKGMFMDCKKLNKIDDGWFNFIPYDNTRESKECFSGMFAGCTQLQSIPTDLLKSCNNVDLSPSCFYGMFAYCVNLKNACVVNPKTHNINSCALMFAGTAITEIPADYLPATTLDEGCYQYMFALCSNLTKVSATLPAETVVSNAYKSMFYDCIKLKTPPKILAKTIEDRGCQEMFYNCAELDVSTDSTGTQFFTCPNDASASACYNMFLKTKKYQQEGSGTPKAGEIYYFN